ncbi:hypothetical protein H0H92_004179 [Tricholoma furcatifolium]|nr:hypothetical protein H0H92_004179 [Tricholoma furcatifolium]
MLKRQRQPSPPLPISSIPLIEDPFPLARRDVKRRRVLSQPLDGISREWTQTYDHDDEEEENITHDDDQAEGCGAREAFATEYKERNNVLRELHTLSQHRLLFASDYQNTPSSPHSNYENQDSAPYKLRTSLRTDGTGDDLSQSHSSMELRRVTQRYEDTNRYDIQPFPPLFRISICIQGS